MLFADGFFGLVIFGLWLFCLIDVITTPEGSVRNLQKTWWVLIVLFFFDIGAVLWLVAGREWNRGTAGLAYKGNRGTPAQPAAAARPRATNPDDDAEFLAGLQARADEQRPDDTTG